MMSLETIDQYEEEEEILLLSKITNQTKSDKVECHMRYDLHSFLPIIEIHIQAFRDVYSYC